MRTFPDIDSRRLRFPDGRLFDPRQVHQGAVFGGHGHVLIGLGQHRRLAGDRIANHRKAVARADGEGVEAVQVLKALVQRLLQAIADAQPPGQVAGRDLRVVLGLEAHALLFEPLAQPVVVGQRAVMHQAQILSGRERVAAGHGHRALGGHAGMADDVRTLHRGQVEALDDGLGPANPLQDLDTAPDAHNTGVRREFGKGRPGVGLVAGKLEHRRGGVLEPVGCAAHPLA